MADETTGAGETPETPEDNSPEALAARIAELEAQLSETSDAFLRARADFQNFKRRTDEEKEGLKSFLTADLLARFLPIADNLERALNAPTREYDKLAEGVGATHRQILDLLSREGVTPIEAQGEPFDPNVHDAVMPEVNPDVPENTVTAVLQTGYRIGNKVLRPALVKVATRD